MSDLAIIPIPGTLGEYSDPAAFVELALTRAKEWLVEAIEQGDIGSIVELKSQAEAIRVYTTQKQLGKDAELNAAEIVRRAERGLGLAVRKGQDEGTIRTPADRDHTWLNQHGRGPFRDVGKTSPTEIFNNHAEVTDAYAMTDDVSDEQFEEALATARDEKNLARANIVRKIKGESVDDKLNVARQLAASGNTVQQIATRLGYTRPGMVEFLKRHDIEVPAEHVVRGTRNLNSTRIVDAAVGSVNGIGMLFDQIVYSDLPAENVQGWLAILNESIRSLTTLRNRLKETSQP